MPLPYWERMLIAKLALAGAVIIVTLLILGWRNRRSLARKADNALVGTLAGGVRLKRRLTGKGARLMDRARERADY